MTTKMYDGINRLIEVRDAYDNIIRQLLYNDADVQISSFDALHIQTQNLYVTNAETCGFGVSVGVGLVSDWVKDKWVGKK